MYLIGYTNSVVEVYEYLSSRIGWKYNPSPLFNLVYPLLSPSPGFHHLNMFSTLFCKRNLDFKNVLKYLIVL